MEQADPDAEVAAFEEEITSVAMNTRTENERPATMTLQLIGDSIARLATIDEGAQLHQVDVKEIDTILHQKVLRVDWLHIGKIENLEAFMRVKELYLQYN
uniref:Uncharacterized protein n=1 Tax=Hyaloperonospora arabidopsidis (strain Emoy2) TaxID=559515 RepID=M4B8V1_HYAAE